MSKQLKILLFTAFLLWSPYLNLAYRTYSIEGIVANHFEGHSNTSFSLTQKERVCVINFMVELFKPLKKHMVHVVALSSPAVGPRLTFLNRTINTCKMLKKKNSNDFLYVFFVGALKRFTNSSLMCPLAKGKYFFNNFQFDVNILPSFIPIVDQKIWFYVRSYDLHSDGREENFLEVRTNGTLRNK